MRRPCVRGSLRGGARSTLGPRAATSGLSVTGALLFRLIGARRAIFALSLAGLLGVMSRQVTYVLYRPAWDPDALTILALGGTGLAALLMLLTQQGLRFTGFVGVFVAFLALAHLGAAGAVLVSPDAFAGFKTFQVQWFYTSYRPIAVALAGLGIGASVLGALLFSFLGTSFGRRPPPSTREWSGIYVVGLGLLTASACYVTGAVLLGKLPLYGGYSQYRSAMSNLPGYGLMLWALATGLAFAVATGDTRQRRGALIVFAIPALVLAMTGNRGEILFPAAAAVAVYTVRGYRFRLGAALAGAFVFFVFIPLATEFRSSGLAETDYGAVTVHWTDPFVINGWTLRPLVYTVGWIENGEQFARGGTYLLPTQRMLGRLTPFVERVEYGDNFSYIKNRLPGQGYSLIAEAYYNFGVLGVILLPASIGAFLAAAGDRARGSASVALVGAIAAVLMNHVRNHGLFVPGQTLLVVIVWLTGVMLTLWMHPTVSGLTHARTGSIGVRPGKRQRRPFPADSRVPGSP